MKALPIIIKALDGIYLTSSSHKGVLFLENIVSNGHIGNTHYSFARHTGSCNTGNFVHTQ